MKIVTEFAAHETSQDSLAAVQALLTPSLWQGHRALDQVNEWLQHESHQPASHISLYLAGRAGILTWLQALKLNQGSYVAVQSFTCAAVPLPVLHLGLKPLYVDIEAETWSMSIKDLEHKAREHHPKAIILQHSFGLTPQDRAAILKWAERHQVPVLEDMAHGYQDGLLADGDTDKLLSFGRSKPWSSVFGGALVVSENSRAATVQALHEQLPPAPRSIILSCLRYKLLGPWLLRLYPYGLGTPLHWLANRLKLFLPEVSQLEKTGHYDTWLDAKYPEVLAYLLLINRVKAGRRTAHRRAIADFYQNHLRQSFGATQLPLLRFPVLVKDRAITIRALRQAGFLPGFWYTHPIAPPAVPLATVEYQLGSCPIAEAHTQQVINLPLTVSLTQADYIQQLVQPHVA